VDNYLINIQIIYLKSMYNSQCYHYHTVSNHSDVFSDIIVPSGDDPLDLFDIMLCVNAAKVSVFFSLVVPGLFRICIAHYHRCWD